MWLNSIHGWDEQIKTIHDDLLLENNTQISKRVEEKLNMKVTIKCCRNETNKIRSN